MFKSQFHSAAESIFITGFFNLGFYVGFQKSFQHLSHPETGSCVCFEKYFGQGQASVCYIEPGARQLDSQAVIPALLLTQWVTIMESLQLPHSAKGEPQAALSKDTERKVELGHYVSWI